MTVGRWASALLLAFALVAGVGLWLQHETTAALQSEIALLRDDQKMLTRLRAENTRLSAAQVPEAELARLRADRAALMRLRSEIEQLKSRAEQTAAAKPLVRIPAKVDSATSPALALRITVRPDGALTIDGAPIDLNFEIRQQLAGLARGDFVKIRFKLPDNAEPDIVKQRVDGLRVLAQEFGLRMEVTYEGMGK